MHHEIKRGSKVRVAQVGGGDAGEGRAGQIGDEDIHLTTLGDQRFASARHTQVAIIGQHHRAFFAENLNRGRAHIVLTLRHQHAFAEQSLGHGGSSCNEYRRAKIESSEENQRAARSAWRRVSTSMPSSSSLAVAAGPSTRISLV